MKNYVAVVDSGIGGITTLSKIVEIIKGYDFIYFSDTKYLPYGNKSKRVITQRLSYITEKFIQNGAVAIVIACNTATNVCIDYLRKNYNITIIGTEPAIKLSKNYNGKTAALVTPLTAKQKKFRKLIKNYGKNIDVVPLKDMANFIQSNINNLNETVSIISQKLSFLSKYDNVVLGCTHYVYLTPYIKNLFPHIKIFDGNVGVANRLKSVLPRNESKKTSVIKFLNKIEDLL